MTRRLSFVLFAAVAALVPAFAQAQQPSPAPSATASAQPPKPGNPSASPSPTPTPGPPYSNYKWREVGPATAGGRVAAVAGSATDPNLYYVGSAGGGVWKSTNAGQTWEPVFGDQKIAAVGAVTIDPNNNDVVWVGTGEANPRNDVSFGDGVYKSTDGGKTWTNVGLAATHQISRILVDPKNSNHIIVGALGDLFTDSEDRGVYVTEDGGKTWTKTLYLSPQSGVSDMAMDVTHPNVVYAGMWHFRRQPWTFTSGGEDDGLFKSTDGGKTWNKLTGNGLPDGITGRIGLAVAPSDGSRVYAIVESDKGILWRSDDAGKTWAMVSNDTLVDQRPFYFTHLAVDPKNPDKVYAVSMMLAVSTDGGKKFKEIAKDVHVDYHAIWIAPNDPNRIMMGEDGGYSLTLDGGSHWFFSMNLPIAQIYRVGLSTHENPYSLCVGLQDNNAWCGPSNSLDGSGILNKHWISVNGGDGEWAVPDPIDNNWIWSDAENGALVIYNKVTQDGWFAQPYIRTGNESYDQRQAKYRFNWETPIAFAPWDGHIAWFGSNVLFQTTDRGHHWTVVSPDLTLNDKAHQAPSGGPITHDVSGAEESDNILYIEGSQVHRGEIWVGTDDGLVQMTRDGGKHWANVTPKGAPQFGRVETVAPSPLVDGTAYAIYDAHYTGNNKPYIFATHDFGKPWSAIVNGIPAGEFVRTVRPDIRDKNLLYAGTELGMYISFDGGQSWKSFKNGMPTVSVHDIRMQPVFNDLVIATHGRSVYVMDDMTPIQQLQRAIARGSMLFKPRAAYEYSQHSNDEGTYTDFAGQNPPTGVSVTFYQKTKAKSSPKLEFLDASGHAVRTVQGTHKVDGKDKPYITNDAGLNTYVWDFQTDGPVKWMGAAKEAYQGPKEGPAVVPGVYAVRLTLDGHSQTQPIDVKPDPRSQFTQADYVRSYELAKKYTHMFSVVDTMLNSLDDLKKQLDTASDSAKKKNDAGLANQVDAALKTREAIFSLLTADYHNDEDSIQRPGKLREDIQGLGFFGGGLITPPVTEFASRIDAAYEAAAAQYNAYVQSFPALDTALQDAGLKPVTGAQRVETKI
ncbi:MAG: WD40/YVTN/BNR-like repeat-containing protein [Vulcanimicrobiaceae bacterium]